MHSLKVNCVLFGAIVLWASAYVGIRIALDGYSPGPLALLRFLVASFCMGIMYRRLGDKKVMPWKDKMQLLIAGMMGIGIYNICLNYGEITVSAGIASFVVGLMPVITVLLSLVFLQEKLNNAVWVGIFISLMGLLLLAMGEGYQVEMRLGLLSILVSALMGAILTIVQKKFLKIYHPVTIMAWIMWGGTLLLTIFSFQLAQEIQSADLQSTVAVIYMGIFPAAVAYVAWSYALKKLPASKASLTLYALPIVTTLMGYLLLGEQPSIISLIGGFIALIGAFIANRFDLNVQLNKKVVAV